MPRDHRPFENTAELGAFWFPSSEELENDMVGIVGCKSKTNVDEMQTQPVMRAFFHVWGDCT
jgi:hypothetical protein